MSLKIWLPLNGSTINQGVAGFQPAAASITYADSGKIGAKCYSGGSIKMSAAQTASIFNNEALTVAFWIKPTKASKNGIIFGNNSNRQFSLFQYTGNTSTASHGLSLHWSWHTTSGSGNNYDTAGNATANELTYLNNVFTENVWSHVCIVYSKTLLQIYIDGILRADRAMSGSASSFEYETYLINNTESSDRQINDLRVYDHALSPREVKLLSQGLVAHYKLDDPYIETTQNLLSSTWHYRDFANASLGPCDKFSKQLNGGPCEVTELNRIRCLRIKTLSGDQSGRIYSTHPGGQGKIYTVSMDYYSNTTNEKALHIELYGNDYTWNGFNCAYDTPNQWKRLKKTLPPLTSNTTIYIFAYAGLNIDAYINNIQLEEKDHATPYTHHDRTDKTIYDCSGYGNHGTESASLETSTDSPRYSYSTVFNNNKYISTPISGFNGIKNSYTFSWWSKITDMNQKMLFGFDGNTNETKLNLYPVENKFCWNQYNHAENPFNAYSGKDASVSSYSNGQWHHYTITGNGSSTLLYINGDLKGKATTYVALPDAKLFISGNDASTSYKWNNGYISDFRIYATSLSAAAVKELYETNFSILNNNILQCGELVENNTNLKLKETGLIQGKLFEEIEYNSLIKLVNQTRLKTLPDGSLWARINYLNVGKNPYSKSSYFNDGVEANDCKNNHYKFSLMNWIDQFKSGSTYEFMLTYPTTLPQDYTELLYLQSSGTQYIDTNFKPNNNTRILIKASSSGPYSIYGVRETGKMFNYTGNSQGQYFYWGSGGNTTITNRYSQVNVLEQNKNIATVDGDNNTKHTYANQTWQANYPIFLFARSDAIDKGGEAGDMGGTVRIYGCQIYDNGTIVRNFVPCKKSDGTYGMYDLVNEIFYDNKGAGTFSGVENTNNTRYNRWKQTSSPHNSSVTGFTGITTSWNAHNAGLRKHNGTSTIYNCDSGSTWYAPIGQLQCWQESMMRAIPGADGNSYQATELWTRIDNLLPNYDISRLSIYYDAFQAYQIQEL